MELHGIMLYGGGMNGFFSVLEDLLKPIKNRLLIRLHIDTNKFMYKMAQRLLTFMLIDFTWLFFRATSFRTALGMLHKIFADFRLAWFINFNFIDMFGSSYNLMVVLFSLMVIILVDILEYYGKDIKVAILNQQAVFRWIIYTGLVLMILYWGFYGTEYEQTQFIYFQF